VRVYASRHRKSITRVADATMAVFVAYHWPGNVRELQNVIERSVVLTKGAELQAPVASLVSTPDTMPVVRTLADADRAHIVSVLRETNWAVGGPNGAAARLGLYRTTLLAKMRKLGITRETAGVCGQCAEPANQRFRGSSSREEPPVDLGSASAGSF
jgi:formate hydrogenlyase transcriptional activator